MDLRKAGAFPSLSLGGGFIYFFPLWLINYTRFRCCGTGLLLNRLALVCNGKGGFFFIAHPLAQTAGVEHHFGSGNLCVKYITLLR